MLVVVLGFLMMRTVTGCGSDEEGGTGISDGCMIVLSDCYVDSWGQWAVDFAVCVVGGDLP